jgi:hypothetical protein
MYANNRIDSDKFTGLSRVHGGLAYACVCGRDIAHGLSPCERLRAIPTFM